MRIASEYRDPAASFFMGVADVRDPNDPSRTLVLASDGAAGVVRIFDLDANGALTPAQSIALPPEGGKHAFPAEIAIAPSGRTAYVVDNLADKVVAIDLVSRSVLRSLGVGDFPLYVAAGTRDILRREPGSRPTCRWLPRHKRRNLFRRYSIRRSPHR